MHGWQIKNNNNNNRNHDLYKTRETGIYLVCKDQANKFGYNGAVRQFRKLIRSQSRYVRQKELYSCVKLLKLENFTFLKNFEDKNLAKIFL